MRAIVERNGSLNGELFIECSHKPDGVHESALRFSVPVTAELPEGTEVEITCEVVEVPVVKLETPTGDITAVTEAPPTESPVAEAPPVAEESPVVEQAPQEEANVQA